MKKDKNIIIEETPPTIDDYLDYLSDMIGSPEKNYTDGLCRPHNHGKAVISTQTISSKFVNLVQYALDHHKGYVMDCVDQKTLSSAIQDAEDWGALSKGMYYPRRKVTITAVQHMNTATLTKLAYTGCSNWDTEISRLLTVSLALATGCRAGAVGLSQGYQNNSLMQYQHIEIFMKPNSSGAARMEDVLGCFIEVAFDKGNKDGQTEGLIHFVQPQLQCPMICPVHWILIHTLRHSLVIRDILDGVFQHAQRQSNLTVKWKHPTAPVICKLNCRSGILMGQPATALEVSKSLRHIAKLSGLKQTISFHAMQRGVAEDGATLGPQAEKPCFNFDTAQLILHHLDKTKHSGTTACYAGNNPEWDHLTE
ncbi:uncharacterized protein MELLADRAFT_96395 [Melampsora larici-populina 98AG31]|uniref:Uncharacterized protein n=1 Tax=Melampsora larici-populina (strain 98AG31 / pathotype 3-4-7) TaxID=747676 RepID=F4REM5_MELLP|nr:uncharacterized protein MELLADRAFT_96395 [Melampsora larici-populina 98AG31]EGG09125.1 hypothetical protein MELLADRAFT_96395 [Melampsora larici-populina 98AG31]